MREGLDLVVVKAFGYIADIIGWDKKNVELESPTMLLELLEKILEQKKLTIITELIERRQAKIMINGMEASLISMVHQEDEIALIPLPSGG